MIPFHPPLCNDEELTGDGPFMFSVRKISRNSNCLLYALPDVISSKLLRGQSFEGYQERRNALLDILGKLKL